MKDKTKYHFSTIKELMQKVLNNNKLSQGLNQLDASDAWRKVMGEGVWTYTEKVHFSNGTITIYLKSSTIREEQSYRKKEIIIMLNAYLKEDLIKKVRLL